MRLVWTSLSPKYEEKFDRNDLATVTFSLLHGAILLAQGEMKARSIRLHLGNVTERDYVLGIAKGLRWTHPNVEIAFAGNWLHIKNVDELHLQSRSGEEP